MIPPTWTPKSIDLIKEACRHGESMLAAQVQMATSADQRASVLAGIYVAAATGVFAAIITSDVIKSSHPLAVGSGFVAASFLLAAVLCIKATLPTDFWPPGNSPSEWYDDIRRSTPLEEAIGQQAAHFDDHIKINNATLIKNANYFWWGAMLGIFAPFVGLAGAGITCLLA